VSHATPSGRYARAIARLRDRSRAAALLLDTIQRWVETGAVTHSAALAFYTLISLAPVLVVAVTVASLVFGEAATRDEIVHQVEMLAGGDAASAVRLVLEETARLELRGWPGVLGVATLLLAASAVFAQLQGALNAVWGVQPRPGGYVRNFLRKRLLSFGLVLAVGFVLMVSLLISTAVSASGAYMRRRLGVGEDLLTALDFVVFLVVITGLFTLMFRLLPDARIAWRDVVVGALLTAIFFSLGKEIIGAYLGRSGLASTYGVAGSLVLLLVWTYYSSMIVLFGAAFTRVATGRWSRRRVEPEPGAVRVSR
jgi:membrane protein